MSGETLLHTVYTTMVRIRAFEEALADLIDAGEVGTPCHLAIGQEAIPASVCAFLNDDDTIWGGHRSHGHYIAKGGALGSMMAEIFGRVTGCSHGRGGSMHIVAPSIGVLGTVPLVAATIPMAAGAALASKIRGEEHVAVAFFGDGATEEGHFHETMNMAALYKLPMIFVCENNFYSSHLSLLERRARDNIVAAADAHGMAGERLDGNDVTTLMPVVEAAVARARAGEGPTLIEARTYRWRGHVGASWDIDVGVKRKDELQQWLDRDPIARLRVVLAEHGVDDFDDVATAAATEVAEAIAFARSSPMPEGGTVLEHVYA